MAGNGPWYPPRPNRFVYIATRAGFSYKVAARRVALSANQRPQLSGAHFVCHTSPLQIAIWSAASNYLFSNSETTPVEYAHSGVRHRNNLCILQNTNRITMPHTYRCRKCHQVHSPPTGKHCRLGSIEVDDTEDSKQGQILAALADIKTRITEMDERLVNIESSEEHDESEDGLSESEEPQAKSSKTTENTSDHENATPSSLRRNIELMAQAAGRIAQYRGDEQDDDELPDMPVTRAQGKKSGSLMVATDKVCQTIDWPHMHVRRVVNGKRKALTYSELKVEEFVFGYLTMLASPRSKMDSTIMIPLLRIVMQYAMDYSWANAMGFYKTLGQEVEHGMLQWHDKETIQEYRMTYSRALFPDKKEAKENKEGARSPPRQAPAGMKCCVAFQKRTCEQVRDHPPFTHACAYCFRTCSIICRHAEQECIRKMADW